MDSTPIHPTREPTLFARIPNWARGLMLAMAATVAAAGAARIGVVSDLMLAFERKSVDYRMARYRGSALTAGLSPSEVVIVAIDEASVARLGRFPLWPRAYHTRLLERLEVAGVRTVAFDVLFSESDALPAAVRGIRATEIARGSPADSAAVDTMLREVGGDADFARALSDFGHAWLAVDPGSGVPPLPVLSAAAAGVGHVAMAPDPDGILRRVTLHPTSEAPLPLGMAAARAHLGGVPEPTIETGAASLRSPEDLILDFIGPRGTFLTLPYVDVLEGKVDDVLLRDRLVFVGASAAGLGDVFATPFSEDLPGVEAHATLALQILQGRSLRSAGPWSGVLPLALAVPTAVALLVLGPVWAGAAALVLAGGYLLGTFEAFAQAGIQLPFTLPLLTWMVAALLSGLYRFGWEQRGRREIRLAFSRYVAPQVVDEIAQRPELLRVGGEAREVTVGFVDIRGFTALSESMEPQRLVRFLHAFFSVVEGEIHARRGTVDKYIGDAVMMVFGAPNDLPDAAVRACDASLGIRDAVMGRAELWEELGVDDLRIGIGLETGVAVVGNIGSERRFDYTALGDTVNVAARLQDMNKELGTTIVVGPGTYAEAAEHFDFTGRGRHSLRGRPGHMVVHELVGLEHDPPDGASERDPHDMRQA